MGVDGAYYDSNGCINFAPPGIFFSEILTFAQIELVAIGMTVEQALQTIAQSCSELQFFAEQNPDGFLESIKQASCFPSNLWIIY